MLSSTRLLSLALLLVGALNAAAAPTPLAQDGELVERQLPGNVAGGHAVLMERAKKTKAPAKAPPPAKAPAKAPPPAKAPAKAPPPAKAPAKAPTPPAGGSKPPQKAPSRPPTPTRAPTPTAPATTKKPKGPPKPQPCATIVDCTSCVNNKCHFDKVTFTCANAGVNRLNKVTTRVGCPQMLQMQKVFPKVGTTRAGVAPAALKTKFTRVSGHIFNGEPTNPNAGRHTLSAFLATHAGATPARRNDRNKIQEFSLGASNVKTVWQDGAGAYDRIDIQNMCVTAAQILSKNGATGGAGGTVGAVVQSPFGIPACITFTEFGGNPTSCFPIGVSTTGRLGGTCNGR